MGHLFHVAPHRCTLSIARHATLSLALAGLMTLGGLFAPVAPVAQAQTRPAASSMKVIGGSDNTWWKHAVLYEIYPRSFQDTNGDGTGDLNGITQHLGYLKKLGIDGIWIAPMFPSPQIDFGYDISDYKAVDPQYGNLADMDRLIAEAKKRNIRVMLDMVLNHSSDKHAWFQESRTSRTNPKADWYMWADGIGPNKDQVPNNWQSVFGHSAWTWVPARKQFYYHKFYPEQPDLNWRKPAVEKAMFDVLRFWLDRGVAGFRLDAIPTLFENEDMKNETVVLDAQGKTSKNAFGDVRLHETQTSNLPEVDVVLRRMRKLVDSYPGERVLVGETYVETIADLDKLYGGTAKDELQLPMDFKIGMINKLDIAAFRKNIAESQTGIHGSQPLFVFDNHDNARMDRYCTAAATMGSAYNSTSPQCMAIQKMLSTILFTSRATSLMYYGDEIGMVTTPPARKQDVKDPIGILGWPLEKGRDGDRTPMQWNVSSNAGFTTSATPWLPVPPSYTTINVQTEEGQPNSLLNWYTSLMNLRHTNGTLHSGSMEMLDTANPKVLSFMRKGPSGTVVVALNFTNSDQTVALDAAGTGKVITLLTDAPNMKNPASLKTISLPAFGTWVGEIH